LSGIVNFSQSGIDALTLVKFHGNPTPVNITLAGAGFVVGSVLVAFVWYEGKIVAQRQLRDSEDAERERLIPEEDEDESEGWM
jgi:hypothetical protein